MELLPNLPFIKEIINDTFTSNNLEDLLNSLQTYNYLNKNSKHIVEEIVWIIGEKEELFNKFFTKKYKSYSVRTNIDKIYYCEFKKRYPKEHSPEELSVRFIKYDNCDLAVFLGNFKMLEWMKQNNVFWNDRTYSSAIMTQDFDMVKWLKENGCPLGFEAFHSAALDGYIGIMQWLRANDCPWDIRTCLYAANKGNYETLKWCIENGCPYEKSVLTECVKNDEVREWIKGLS